METKDYRDVDELTESIAYLIPDLAENNNYQKKSNARRFLVDKGKKILPQINQLLNTKNPHIRKEASKIIELIGAQESIPILIHLLDDDEGSIRWIAAEGLVHIGRETIVPLLNEIIEHGDNLYLKLGARHVFLRLFSDDEREYFRPLLLSLKNYNNISILAPVEAFRALFIFKHQNAKVSKPEYWH